MFGSNYSHKTIISVGSKPQNTLYTKTVFVLDSRRNEQYGVTQRVDAYHDALPNFIMNWKSYMANVVMVEKSYKSVRDRCKNEHELCSFWAMLGECDKNPSYMKVNCAPACQSCEQLDFNKRCPFDVDKAKNAFDVGDVDRFFERVVEDEEFAKYNITVHSRPKREDDDQSFENGPWLITLDDFVTVSYSSCIV